MNPPTLLLGDCIEQMQFWLPDNSVDAIVTDPPYGLSFMGKKWDYDVPQVAVWAECLRVLKPGGYLLAFAGTRTQHRMCVNIEDAGFEIRDMIAWVYGCLDAETEVLTRRGWINYRELTAGDEVMQWSHADGALSWVVPSAVHEYPFDGDMVVLENRHTRQVLTPNHRVYAKVRRHARNDKAQHYEVLDAADLFNRPSNWQVDLPLAGLLKGGVTIAPEYAYLAGWWLTDAWPHGDGKACMFSQCKPATLAKLRAALSPHGASEYVRGRGNPNHADEHTFYLAGPMADRLQVDFPARVLPWGVLGWSEEARRALYEGLMDGDGSRNKDGQHAEAFWSQDAQRRGVFTALALSLGIRAFENASNSVVNVNPTRCTTQIQSKHRPTTLRYTGMVWCVTVPHGAFVVRREGRPFITGNSGFPKSLDVSKAIDKAAGVAFGSRPASGVGFMGADGPGGYNPTKHQLFRTGDTTEAASQWQGWGTALKPSAETITVAVKPLGDAGERRIIQLNLTMLEVRLWLLSFANVAQDHSTSSQKEYGEAFAIARWTVAEFINIRDALCEAMGTSQFASACRSSLNIVSSWSRTLADAWTDMSMFTTSTTSSMTIDLRTLKFSLSQITPESIIRASNCPGGFNANASIAERHFNASLSLLENTQTLFATGHAMSLALENSRNVNIPVQLDPCVVARKPLSEKTVADNVLRWGTGGLNIDACRVEYADLTDMDRARVPQPSFNTTGAIYNMKTGSGRNGSVFDPSGGRWPANLIHDGSDEVVSFFPDAKGQLADVSTTAPSEKTSNVYGKMRREGEPSADSDNEGAVGFKMKPGARRLDSGSAARFFYAAKASKADRNSGGDNGHPTVKPTDLMRYLCRLVTQPGGVVLDPFMGSGSTGKAARLEGFDFIGIERDPDYMRIAEARIK